MLSLRFSCPGWPGVCILQQAPHCKGLTSCGICIRAFEPSDEFREMLYVCKWCQKCSASCDTEATLPRVIVQWQFCVSLRKSRTQSLFLHFPAAILAWRYICSLCASRSCQQLLTRRIWSEIGAVTCPQSVCLCLIQTYKWVSPSSLISVVQRKHNKVTYALYKVCAGSCSNCNFSYWNP